MPGAYMTFEPIPEQWFVTILPNNPNPPTKAIPEYLPILHQGFITLPQATPQALVPHISGN